MNKEFLTINHIMNQLEMSKSSIWRKLKEKRQFLKDNKLIIESQGKEKTLYHNSILEFLKGEPVNFNQFMNEKGDLIKNSEIKKESVESVKTNYFTQPVQPFQEKIKDSINKETLTSSTVSQPVQEKNNSHELDLLKKDIEYLTKKIEDKEEIINSAKEYKKEIQKELNHYKNTLSDKDAHISELTNLIGELTNRHDTIILTMSKQLEGLNTKLLTFEETQKKVPEKSKHHYVYMYLLAIIFFILIIVYFKILFI